MAFTTEERYRAYADWTPEYIEKIKKNTESSPWRTNFHYRDWETNSKIGRAHV